MNFDPKSQATLDEAQAAGFDIIMDANIAVKQEALRLLPPECTAIGFDIAGDVLAVITDIIPTPAELREYEKLSGMQVTVSVAPTSVFESIKAAHDITQDAAGVPLSIGPILQLAVERNATDVHLTIGQAPVLRIHGDLSPIDKHAPLSLKDVEAAARWVAGPDFDNFTGDYDCAMTYAGSRWRVSLYLQRQSLALAIRRIPTGIPKLEELGLPESVRRLAGITQGLVLFCGPTGSGKSTSLAALLDRINMTRACHILTIEDPIEYIHSSKKATIHQREVGDDTANFASGLRSALRQDPDVILVGELRDLETMQMALAAAETGHLVLATVHAASTDEVFGRIINPFPAEQQGQIRTQLAAVTRAVVAQQLLPSTDGKRVLSSEILIGTTAVRNMIRDDRVVELASKLDSATADGMRSFDRCLAELTAAGKITQETAVTWARDVPNFHQHLSACAKVSRGNLDLNSYEDFGLGR